MFCITCPSLLYNFLLVITNTHFRILLLLLHGHVMQLGWKMVFVDSLTSRIPFPSFQQHCHTSFPLYHQAELGSLFRKTVSIFFVSKSNRHAIMICTYNFKVFWNNVHNWKSFQNISVLSTPLIFTSLSSNAVTFDNPKCGPDSQGSEVHMYVQVGNIANENGICCCKAVFHLRILSTSYSSLCQSSAFQNNFGFHLWNNI